VKKVDYLKITKYVAAAVCFILLCFCAREWKKIETDHNGNKTMRKMAMMELLFWIMMLMLTIGRVDVFITFA
jgi:hypothetical protein